MSKEKAGCCVWVKASEKTFLEDNDWQFLHMRYVQDHVKLDTYLFEVRDNALMKIGGNGRLEFDEVEWLDEAAHPVAEDAIAYFERHKRTFDGINAGQYLDKEDFLNFVSKPVAVESIPTDEERKAAYEKFMFDKRFNNLSPQTKQKVFEYFEKYNNNKTASLAEAVNTVNVELLQAKERIKELEGKNNEIWKI